MSAFYNVDQPPFNMSSAARAIAAANNGLLFDIGDMSTMFQDAAGTIPVTAVEQPVGKILDKSGNGNHATQSITASRPTLSARYNLLLATESFSGWSLANGATLQSNATLSPVGTMTAAKLIAPATTGIDRDIRLTVYAKGPMAYKWFVKKAELNFCQFTGLARLPTQGEFKTILNLTTLEQYKLSGSVGLNVTRLSGGWLMIDAAIPDQPASTQREIRFTLVGSQTDQTIVGDGVSGVYIWGADLRVGTTSGPYQRVNTATDYDTNPALFPKYLKFDGVDDYLNLPYMRLYGGGAASIIAARNAVSQATDTYIISERSTSSASPKYFPSRQLAGGGNMDSYISDDTSAVVLDTIGSAFSGASDKVIRSVVDTGNNIKLFKNGVLAADDNYTRSGTLTLNNTTIGASVSTTTSNYTSMKLYGLIITKSALTDAQRIRCERFLARKAG